MVAKAERKPAPVAVWNRISRRINTGEVDWDLLADQLESGVTGKIEIDVKDGIAQGGRMIVSLKL